MHKRGFTLVEMLVAVVVLAVVTITLLTFLVHSGRLAARNQNQATTTAKVRQSLERIVSDIEASDLVLKQYPPTGSPSIISDSGTGLILRQPRFDTNGQLLADTFDVVIYRLVKPAKDNVPGSLKRYVGTITNGVASDALLDRIVLDNVIAMELGYTSCQQFAAAAGQDTFTLTENAYDPKTPCAPPAQALVNGTDLLATGEATINKDSLVLKAPLAAASTIDLTMPINPSSTSMTGGATGTTMVTISVTPLTTWKTAAMTDAGQETTIMTSAYLRNRS